MGYYFECDTCNYNQPLSSEEVGAANLHTSCGSCGIDGCTMCIQDGLCGDCFNAQEDAQQEADNQWDDDDAEAE